MDIVFIQDLKHRNCDCQRIFYAHTYNTCLHIFECEARPEFDHLILRTYPDMPVIQFRLLEPVRVRMLRHWFWGSAVLSTPQHNSQRNRDKEHQGHQHM